MTTPTLPTKHGVGPSCITLPPGQWPTLLDFLAHRFPAISRDEWMARMARGDVVNQQGHALQSSLAYEAHSRVFYYRHLPNEARIPFEAEVLFQDELLVVADKPHFLPVMPSGRYVQETLLVRLKRKLGIDTLAPLHRIDRDTAGLVAFTVQPATRDRYAALFRQRAVSKQYEAIAPLRDDLVLPLTYRSRLEEGARYMQMREVHGAPNAETRIELLDTKDRLARYKLSPITGKKHQLRAHMSALGIPIVNDRIYPTLRSPDADGYDKPLQLLAKELSFTDPVTGDARAFLSEQHLRLE